MTVSILLAVYNGEKYITKSIDSVLSQSYKDFELLIGFNGTTDKSKEIVSNYNDSRIRIFDYQNEKGKAKTLNKLLKECKGDWIAIQDDDDIWMEDKLEKQIKFIEEYDVIGSQIKYINEVEEEIGAPTLAEEDAVIKRKSLNGDNQIGNTSAIVRKKSAEEINGWNLDLDGIEDFDFWLRLMRNGCRFKNVNSTLVLHRLHTQSNFNTKKHDLSKILREEERTEEKKPKSWKNFFGILKR